MEYFYYSCVIMYDDLNVFYFMPHIGGVEKHVYKVSLELLKRGHGVTILTMQHETSLPYYDTVENIDIFRMPFKESQSISNIWYWLMKFFVLHERS